MPTPPLQPPIYIKPSSAQVAPTPNPHPTCRTCRYSLNYLPAGPCPECGTPFDPNNPATLFDRFSPIHAGVRRAAHSRPGWLVINAYAFTALPFFILLNAPSPNIPNEAEAWLNFILYLPISFWALAFLNHLGGRALAAFTAARQPRWSWRWLFPPLIFLLCFFIIQSSAIWHARWFLARPAFEAVARDPSANPTSLGTFNIRRILRFSNGDVRFDLGFPDDLRSTTPPSLYHTVEPRKQDPRYRNPRKITLERNWYFELD